MSHPNASPCKRARPKRAPSARTAAAIALVGLLLLVQVKAWSAQEVCVVPVQEINAHPNCIALSALPDWLRKNAKRDPQGQASDDVVVRLSEGIHRLASPVVIDAATWKSGGKQLRIEGLGSSKTMIVGSVAANTSVVPDTVRVDKKLPLGVVQIALKHLGITTPEQLFEYRFGKSVLPGLELFANDIRLPRSRWPNTGFDTVASVDMQAGLRFTARGQDVRRYAGEPALMLGGFFANDWADETLRAGDVGRTGIQFLQTQPTYGVKVGQRIWFENALSDIDMPGEWAIEPSTQIVYLLPDANQPNATYEISKSLEGFVFSKVWNVSLKNIGFSRFRDNAIRVDEGLDVALRGISIRNSGGVAVRLNGRNVVAQDLQVADIGAAGVALSGGNRVTLTPGRVALRNCTISRVGRLSKTYRPAVGLAGVGNEVTNCHLSDGPHTAILFHGNNHLIEGNQIDRFVLETDDAGAIYTGQDWTERGTVIRGNILRNLGMPRSRYGANAIYLDDQASGIIVTNNIILNSQRGVMIGGGRDNRVEGNIFSGCSDGIYIDSRGSRDIELQGAQANQAYRKKFMDVNAGSPQYTASYPDFLAAGMEALGNAGNNYAHDNVFADCIAPYVVKLPAQKALIVNKTYIAKPGVVVEPPEPVTPSQLIQFREALISKAKSIAPREATKVIP